MRASECLRFVGWLVGPSVGRSVQPSVGRSVHRGPEGTLYLHFYITYFLLFGLISDRECIFQDAHFFQLFFVFVAEHRQNFFLALNDKGQQDAFAVVLVYLKPFLARDNVFLKGTLLPKVLGFCWVSSTLLKLTKT